MTRPRAYQFVTLFAATMLAAAAVPTGTSDPAPLTVHEWGTFTSIAGADGTAVSWLTQAGPQDLPCFVDRLRTDIKGIVRGTVRMETPVIYFYAPQETTVNVTVGFHDGLVTEWFPRATVTPAALDIQTARSAAWRSRITWNNVKVSPRILRDFPVEKGPSHYYAARETDATPLQSGSQKEKFLFYRGVGRFAPPITAILRADGKVDVANPQGDPVGSVILFENRHGSITFRSTPAPTARMTIDATAPTGSLASLRRELERMLVAHGLYPKEAAAMVETWRDSWFEEGTRLFYIASKRAIDSILPLEVTPVPADVARVFVGRVELMTPRTLAEVKQAILSNDRTTFARYGRFLQPITDRILSDSAPAERGALQQRSNAAYTAYYTALTQQNVCR